MTCPGGSPWATWLGSVAFGVSAMAAKFVSAAELRSAGWTTLGTFVGGICFLGASILLLPERTQAGDEAEAAATDLLDPPPGPVPDRRFVCACGPRACLRLRNDVWTSVAVLPGG